MQNLAGISPMQNSAVAPTDAAPAIPSSARGAAKGAVRGASGEGGSGAGSGSSSSSGNTPPDVLTPRNSSWSDVSSLNDDDGGGGGAGGAAAATPAGAGGLPSKSALSFSRLRAAAAGRRAPELQFDELAASPAGGGGRGRRGKREAGAAGAAGSPSASSPASVPDGGGDGRRPGSLTAIARDTPRRIAGALYSQLRYASAAGSPRRWGKRGSVSPHAAAAPAQFLPAAGAGWARSPDFPARALTELAAGGVAGTRRSGGGCFAAAGVGSPVGNAGGMFERTAAGEADAGEAGEAGGAGEAGAREAGLAGAGLAGAGFGGAMFQKAKSAPDGPSGLAASSGLREIPAANFGGGHNFFAQPGSPADGAGGPGSGLLLDAFSPLVGPAAGGSFYAAFSPENKAAAGAAGAKGAVSAATGVGAGPRAAAAGGGGGGSASAAGSAGKAAGGAGKAAGDAGRAAGGAGGDAAGFAGAAAAPALDRSKIDREEFSQAQRLLHRAVPRGRAEPGESEDVAGGRAGSETPALSRWLPAVVAAGDAAGGVAAGGGCPSRASGTRSAESLGEYFGGAEPVKINPETFGAGGVPGGEAGGSAGGEAGFGGGSGFAGGVGSASSAPGAVSLFGGSGGALGALGARSGGSDGSAAEDATANFGFDAGAGAGSGGPGLSGSDELSQSRPSLMARPPSRSRRRRRRSVIQMIFNRKRSHHRLGAVRSAAAGTGPRPDEASPSGTSDAAFDGGDQHSLDTLDLHDEDGAESPGGEGEDRTPTAAAAAGGGGGGGDAEFNACSFGRRTSVSTAPDLELFPNSSRCRKVGSSARPPRALASAARASMFRASFIEELQGATPAATPAASAAPAAAAAAGDEDPAAGDPHPRGDRRSLFDNIHSFFGRARKGLMPFPAAEDGGPLNGGGDGTDGGPAGGGAGGSGATSSAGACSGGGAGGGSAASAAVAGSSAAPAGAAAAAALASAGPASRMRPLQLPPDAAAGAGDASPAITDAGSSTGAAQSAFEDSGSSPGSAASGGGASSLLLLNAEFTPPGAETATAAAAARNAEPHFSALKLVRKRGLPRFGVRLLRPPAPAAAK